MVTSTLRALGVAIFAGIAVLVGVVLRWLILRDDSFSQRNLEQANFLIAIAGLVATGALIIVALNLVKWPDRGR
ncbi:MAG TPA: hypothetical protein VLA89_07210 [Gemmatimonadales bacterium]|nr:hypothetical protein [Gemmatimonadales bacterium]